MKCIGLAAGLFSILFFFGCESQQNPPIKELSTNDQIAENIKQLKETAQTGDLLVRLNDDVISDRVRFINEKDKTYSHTGLVIERNNEKYVAHISPEPGLGDTIQYIPIDSFINPVKNIKCAMYRYEMSNNEKQKMAFIIDSFKTAGIRFDPVYELTSDDKLYCSEMISKALKQATNNRIVCRETTVPKNMQKAVVMFFKTQKISPKQASLQKIMTIDNLYLREDCTMLMQFQLKYFPEQLQ